MGERAHRDSKVASKTREMEKKKQAFDESKRRFEQQRLQHNKYWLTHDSIVKKKRAKIVPASSSSVSSSEQDSVQHSKKRTSRHVPTTMLAPAPVEEPNLEESQVQKKGFLKKFGAMSRVLQSLNLKQVPEEEDPMKRDFPTFESVVIPGLIPESNKHTESTHRSSRQHRHRSSKRQPKKLERSNSDSSNMETLEKLDDPGTSKNHQQSKTAKQVKENHYKEIMSKVVYVRGQKIFDNPMVLHKGKMLRAEDWAVWRQAGFNFIGDLYQGGNRINFKEIHAKFDRRYTSFGDDLDKICDSIPLDWREALWVTDEMIFKKL